jgi:hypothetical protein
VGCVVGRCTCYERIEMRLTRLRVETAPLGSVEAQWRCRRGLVLALRCGDALCGGLEERV